MGRYYGSEPLRNPELQKKAIDYAMSNVAVKTLITLLVALPTLGNRGYWTLFQAR